MRHVSPAAILLVLSLSSPGRGDPPQAAGPKAPPSPLPHAGQLEWDLHVFEESPTFRVVRREVQGRQVVWVLENRRGLGTEITFGYQAVLYDSDGVKLATLEIVTEPFLLNMAQGERNRFRLALPPADRLKGVRQVVIKNGPF